MTTITWQSRTAVVYESFQRKELINAANGGNAYDFYAARVLSEHFNLNIDQFAINATNENSINYALRMRRHKIATDVMIMEPYPLIFGRRSPGTKTIAMIHHLENHPDSIKHQIFHSLLKKQLRKTDLIVTVSAFWADYLRNTGCKNVKVIYNSFNPADYEISIDNVVSFKKKHGFNENDPIIYIGNASRQKGVYETYEALKNSNFQLVMTGSINKAPDLPVKFLNLDRPDYIALLNAAAVVVTFSSLIEGWNRIAHEAMLSKTPVIGSGKGGMKELLTGGGQQILENTAGLHEAIMHAISNREELGLSGYNYAKKFNPEYFSNEWVSAIQEVTKS